MNTRTQLIKNLYKNHYPFNNFHTVSWLFILSEHKHYCNKKIAPRAASLVKQQLYLVDISRISRSNKFLFTVASVYF